jgi:hypothetical protein
VRIGSDNELRVSKKFTVLSFPRCYGALASSRLDHHLHLRGGLHPVSLALPVSVCLGSRLAVAARAEVIVPDFWAIIANFHSTWQTLTYINWHPKN